MEYIIRNMQEVDREAVLEMMRPFYASEAVLTDGSEEIFQADIDHCVGPSPYAEGFIFEAEQKVVGYAMIAKSYSTEFGKPCIWIEDLYVKADYRRQGIARSFFRHVEQAYPNSIYRLEVERENLQARKVYTTCGFTELPYMEMKK